jgi:hypothetical protein
MIMTNPNFISKKYPFFHLKHWKEQQEFMIDELGMTYGQFCSALKRCWDGYKIASGSGDIHSMKEYAFRINYLKTGFGLEETDFQIEYIEGDEDQDNDNGTNDKSKDDI